MLYTQLANYYNVLTGESDDEQQLALQQNETQTESDPKTSICVGFTWPQIELGESQSDKIYV